MYYRSQLSNIIPTVRISFSRSPWRILRTIVMATLIFAGAGIALATTFNVDVGASGSLMYSPSFIEIQPGDTVKWTWKGTNHSVTSVTPGHATGLFDSGIKGNGSTFSFTFPNSGTFLYFCIPHGSCCGMIGTVMVAGSTPTPSPSPTPTPAQPLNISTRMDVLTDTQVLIGGFIVTGNDPKE